MKAAQCKIWESLTGAPLQQATVITAKEALPRTLLINTRIVVS